MLLFSLQRKGSELSASPHGATVYCKGPAASFKKLSQFFGEAPPRIENIESLLEDLGYMEHLPV